MKYRAIALALAAIATIWSVASAQPSEPAAQVIDVRRDPGLVRRVQAALRERGYDVGPVDGKFGPKTESAVRAFREDNGLVVRPLIDSELLADLAIDYTAPQQARTPDLKRLYE